MERVTGKRMTIWPGECHVHAGIRPAHINRMRAERPGAEFLIHPECGCATECMEYAAAGDIARGGVHIFSTSGMLDHVRRHAEGEYIVATETGMLHPMRKAAPGATLTPANPKAVCKYMKMITLPKLRDALRDMRFEVRVPAEIASRARLPIERMVAIG